MAKKDHQKAETYFEDEKVRVLLRNIKEDEKTLHLKKDRASRLKVLQDRLNPLIPQMEALATEIKDRDSSLFRPMIFNWSWDWETTVIENKLTKLHMQAEKILCENSSERYHRSNMGISRRGPMTDQISVIDVRRTVENLQKSKNKVDKFCNMLIKRIETAQRQIIRLKQIKSQKIDKANKEVLKQKRTESKKQSDRSLVARVKNKSRQEAKRIKSLLEITKYCPYCCMKIGESPHADHIYPLSSGGLETIENMVYVCSKCNLEKSDLTLREFCIRRNFDIEDVAKRLTAMGKRC